LKVVVICWVELIVIVVVVVVVEIVVVEIIVVVVVGWNCCIYFTISIRTRLVPYLTSQVVTKRGNKLQYLKKKKKKKNCKGEAK